MTRFPNQNPREYMGQYMGHTELTLLVRERPFPLAKTVKTINPLASGRNSLLDLRLFDDEAAALWAWPFGPSPDAATVHWVCPA